MRSPHYALAGFANTVGWPSALFIEHFGWRGACIAWAVLHLVIGLPMNRLLIPRAASHAPEKAPEHEAGPAGISWTMIVLAAVFGATETVPNMGVIKPPCETSGDADSCCRDPLQTSR